MLDNPSLDVSNYYSSLNLISWLVQAVEKSELPFREGGGGSFNFFNCYFVFSPSFLKTIKPANRKLLAILI